MHRGLACWVAGLLVVAFVVAPAAATGAPDGPLGVEQEDFEADKVTLSASLDDDGSAAWTFRYRMELETENDTAAFESLQQDIEDNQSAYADQFGSRMEGTVSSAENATGREMSVENVSVRAYQQPGGEFADSYGFVEYTFEWNGFAAVDGDRVTAGDSLAGFYLDNETSLEFSWEDDYAAVDAAPSPDESDATSVRWNGEAEFDTDQPRVVLEPADSSGATSVPTETTTPTGGGTSGSSLLPFLVAGVGAVAVAAAGWLYWRREYGDGSGGPQPSADEDGTGGSGAASAAGAAGAAAGESDDPPEELLSNEERVEKFLRENDGRAKQQAVVEAMGWTEAKTSQVVKEMRENDRLESFRIGRENVLKLPEADQLED